MAGFPVTRAGAILAVSDFQASLAFYRDRLGLQLLFEAPPSMAFLECGGIRLMLTIPEGAHDHPSSILYFTVGDIDAAFDELRANDVDFIDAPHLISRMGSTELWMAFFRDPDGNVMGLMQERRVG